MLTYRSVNLNHFVFVLIDKRHSFDVVALYVLVFLVLLQYFHLVDVLLFVIQYVHMYVVYSFGDAHSLSLTYLLTCQLIVLFHLIIVLVNEKRTTFVNVVKFLVFSIGSFVLLELIFLSFGKDDV